MAATNTQKEKFSNDIADINTSVGNVVNSKNIFPTSKKNYKSEKRRNEMKEKQ
jgi:hypothetical protein